MLLVPLHFPGLSVPKLSPLFQLLYTSVAVHGIPAANTKPNQLLLPDTAGKNLSINKEFNSFSRIRYPGLGPVVLLY